MVIKVLKKHCKEIKSVDLSYSEYPCDSSDITLDLALDGVRLIFSAASQRLRLIEIYDLGKVQLLRSVLINLTHIIFSIREFIRLFLALKSKMCSSLWWASYKFKISYTNTISNRFFVWCNASGRIRSKN